MEAGIRDPEIFIRSMATRGHVGGLAPSAFESIALIEAAKRDFIIVETIGAGQDEVEVADAVGLTLVVLAPGLGDELQASKAGLLEIADIIVINKADRDEADRLATDMSSSLTGRAEPPPILRTAAINGHGVDDLLDKVYELDSRAEPANDVRRGFVEGWLRRAILQEMHDSIPAEVWEEEVQNVMARRTDPFTAVEKILDSISGC
jgi:LAO/AO transport system kinase